MSTDFIPALTALQDAIGEAVKALQEAKPVAGFTVGQYISAEQMHELPAGSSAVDKDDDPWFVGEDGFSFSAEDAAEGLYTSYRVETYAPFRIATLAEPTVEEEPEAEPEPAVVRGGPDVAVGDTVRVIKVTLPDDHRTGSASGYIRAFEGTEAVVSSTDYLPRYLVAGGWGVKEWEKVTAPAEALADGERELLGLPVVGDRVRITNTGSFGSADFLDGQIGVLQGALTDYNERPYFRVTLETDTASHWFKAGTVVSAEQVEAAPAPEPEPEPETKPEAAPFEVPLSYTGGVKYEFHSENNPDTEVRVERGYQSDGHAFLAISDDDFTAAVWLTREETKRVIACLQAIVDDPAV